MAKQKGAVAGQGQDVPPEVLPAPDAPTEPAQDAPTEPAADAPADPAADAPPAPPAPAFYCRGCASEVPASSETCPACGFTGETVTANRLAKRE